MDERELTENINGVEDPENMVSAAAGSGDGFDAVSNEATETIETTAVPVTDETMPVSGSDAIQQIPQPGSDIEPGLTFQTQNVYTQAPAGFDMPGQPGGFDQSTQPGGFGQSAQPGGFGQSAPDEMKKGSATPLLIAMGCLFVLLIGLSIYAASQLSKVLDKGKKGDQQYESQADDPWKEILGDDDKDKGDTASGDEKKSDSDNGSGWFSKRDEDKNDNDRDDGKSDDKKDEKEDSGDDSDVVRQSDLADYDDTSWKEPYPNHDRSTYEGKQYYENFEDSIDTSVSYKVKREFDSIYNKKLNVCLRCSYIQLEGDIPNLTDINAKLKEYGRYYLAYYEDNKNTIDEVLESNKEYNYVSDSKSYVPYNDSDNISVVIQDDVYLAGRSDIHLSAVNINLITGTILDNSGILNLPDDYGAVFRERSEKQNGHIEALTRASDELILSYLKDPENQIVFYTPIGLEVGFEYTAGGTTGWVTISLKDYQDLLWGM